MACIEMSICFDVHRDFDGAFPSYGVEVPLPHWSTDVLCLQEISHMTVFVGFYLTVEICS